MTAPAPAQSHGLKEQDQLAAQELTPDLAQDLARDVIQELPFPLAALPGDETAPAMLPQIVRKFYKPRKERMPRVKKYALASSLARDSALSGAVPAGPVVVSAEEVRKAQAAKAVQPRPASHELSATFAWAGGVTDVRKVDALLQRLIDGGARADDSQGDRSREEESREEGSRQMA